MWARGRAVGNVYPRCPRTGPATFSRLVHMSTAGRSRSRGVGVLVVGSPQGQCTVGASVANRSAVPNSCAALRAKRALA